MRCLMVYKTCTLTSLQGIAIIGGVGCGQAQQIRYARSPGAMQSFRCPEIWHTDGGPSPLHTPRAPPQLIM